MGSPCLEAPNALLGNIEGAHRVHGWSVPLRTVKTLLGLEMAILNPIGEPSPYVHDVQSNALRDQRAWESSDPVSAIAAAAGLPNPTPTDDLRRPVFLDIGAQLGYSSLAFAARGYRCAFNTHAHTRRCRIVPGSNVRRPEHHTDSEHVYPGSMHSVFAIEPMTQNVLAMNASLCLNAPLRPRVTLLQAAAVGARQQPGSCAIYSPFRPANDFGNGKMECVNRSGASQCARKHNGETIRANFTYFFHYRRFCQQLQPLVTLDQLLTTKPELAELVQQPSAISVARLDVNGAECDLLTGGGARRFLEEWRPRVLLINVKSARSDACTRTLAQAHGYSVHPIHLGDGKFVVLRASEVGAALAGSSGRGSA